MDARVFDIDGTLLESFEADSDLFLMAVRRVVGISEVSRDWSKYPHVTDQGVLREIFRVNGISPEPGLFEATQREFVSLLKAHIDEMGPFREIPGAKEFISRLVASDHHYVAYATGAWRESALLKLKSAGFPLDGIHVSTSSEHEDRVSIMRAAIAGVSGALRNVTYYGDGLWDQTAAQELGWNFVAVGAKLEGILHFNEVAA